MINIKDSLLFLKICRNTICEMYDNKELNHFILNEASDYQIMNVIINNEIPTEKYNITKENQLWEQFQDLIYENNNSLYKLIVEMGPISHYNLSSSKKFLQFLKEAGDQQAYAQGLYNNMKTAMKSAKSTIKQGAKASAELANDTSRKGSINKISDGMNAGSAASMIDFSASKLYQEYLAKANQACKGKPDKVACMKGFKTRGMRMRIEKLRSGMSACNKAKNSENCQKSLQKKITRLQTKFDRIK
jgi:hypothetical protein